MCANGKASGNFGKADVMEIEILEDGTIKTTTGAVSGANHANAEQFLKYMATLAGGTTERVKRGDVQTNHHHHHGEHEHDKH